MAALIHKGVNVVYVIGITSNKGGSSKTTTAINLAVAAHVAGYETIICDVDPQGTAEAWGDWRKNQPPVVISAKAGNLQKVLDRAFEAGAEIAIVDTPPLAQAEAAATVRMADLVLIPCRPRAFDLHAVRITADLVKTLSKAGFVVFSGGHPSATGIFYAEPEEIVKALDLQLAPARLADRADFHRAVMTGQSVIETEPNGRAASEILELWKWVAKCADVSTQKNKFTKTR